MEPEQVAMAHLEEETLDRIQERLWVLQAKAGDTEAFGKLLARHEQRLIYFLRRLIPRPEDVLDAHQELWLDIFRGLRNLRSPDAFRGWLYRLARAKAARFFHRDFQETARLEPLDDEHAELGDGAAPVADVEAIHLALDRLPEAQREVLTLHYLRDLSLEEIAEAVECPVGTVKSRLHHARLAMRQQIERNRHE